MTGEDYAWSDCAGAYFRLRAMISSNIVSRGFLVSSILKSVYRYTDCTESLTVKVRTEVVAGSNHNHWVTVVILLHFYYKLKTMIWRGQEDWWQ